MKAINKVHPDKVYNATIQQKLIAQGIFYTLNQAYDSFKMKNNL